ncbi:SH3 domain-containing protein [Bacillus sp. PS06]|uniref:SH3 domain-containing protein n=1 Tax=Bacillus sp. PS06 TaxID=2764176 RepID=UPI0017861322|nr:SH3 domain-containing protein [Bacillus sp. PS06]MBD8068093.1 SH3 domain-containing protein [Bacillus sp. PS06]
MKKVILPTLCFAVLSTAAFEQTIQASTIKTTNSEKNTINHTYEKIVNINAGSNLNVRKEPSIHAQILTKLKKGATVTMHSESNGWAEITANGVKGFVSVDYLSNPTTTNLINSVSTKTINVNAGSNLNLRKSPTISSEVLAKLTKGTVVTVLSETNGWAKIKVNGKEGYVSSQYLQTPKSNSSSTSTGTTDNKPSTISTKIVNVSANSSLNVRNQPNTNSTIILKLNKGKQVTVYSNSNGWSKIKVEGKEGYVSSQYLSSSTNNSSQKETISTPDKKEDPITKYVNVSKGSNLNMRSSGSTNGSIILKLASGVKVTVLSESNGWSKIKAYGKEGYVSTQYLTVKSATPDVKPPVKEEVIIKYVNVSSNSTLNLRSSATTNATITAKLANGTEVKVLSESNGWSKVQANGKEGYVSTQYLTVKSATPDVKPPVKEEVIIKYVNVSSNSTLNLRSSATTNATITAKLANGTEVKVLSESNGWSKVQANGKEGYVSTQYLTVKSATPDVKPPVKEEVIIKYVDVSSNSTLNLRSSASTNATITAKLAKGTEVKVLSESNGWSKVQANGKEGYVSSEFLSDKKENIKEEDSSVKTPDNQDSEELITTIKYVNVTSGSSLKMRNKPSTDASVIVKLARSVEVEVLSESNGWSKINVYGHEGFVSSEFLSLTKPEIIKDEEKETNPIESEVISKYVNVSNGSSLNLRSSASTTGTVISKLSRGTVVTVQSEENGWSKVSVNGQVGYVSTQYLSTTEVNNSTSFNGTITKTDVLYDLTIDEFTKLQMAVKPQTDKKYATYIREDALVFDNSELPSVGTVSGNVWNVRGGAGTDFWVVGQVTNGQKLQIISNSKDKDGYIWYEVQYNKSWVNANPEDVKHYLNPSNFSDHAVESLQFLKLSETTKLDVDEVNSRILAGKGILTNQAATFLAAGEISGVNEIYLISHALLETGNGQSQLATGVQYKGKTVYNMYGIGAYDGTALESGAEYAYKAGWFTPEAAIIGGAEFISQGYIKAGQDTLYKMRWNPGGAVAKGSATHQYATDIGWASKQVKQIYNLYSLLDSYSVTLEIPKYK